jgi:hypothetical protein
MKFNKGIDYNKKFFYEIFLLNFSYKNLVKKK